MNVKKFSLQTVLDLRLRAKEKAEDALRSAHLALHAARELRAGAEAELEQMALLISGERLLAAARHQGWVAYMGQNDFCKLLQAHEREKERQVEAATKLLVKARCDYELVLKLKQKWERARQAEFARREERQLEEFFTSSRYVEGSIAC
jgi:flagellar biosynthesis chaperone FliJ